MDNDSFASERAIVPSSGDDSSYLVYSVLGSDCTTGELVTLEQEQRFKGLYVIGKTGSEKATSGKGANNVE